MSYEFADRLIEMRRAKGLSQEELAKELGLSRQAVSKWERAESAPDIGNLVALASLYDVSLDELVRGKEKASAPDDDAATQDGESDGVVGTGSQAAEASLAGEQPSEEGAAGNVPCEPTSPTGAASPTPSSGATRPPEPPAPPVPGTAQAPAAPPAPKKKRTWLKVTLIVVLCVLLAGGIASCGIGCTLGATHAANIANRLASRYDQLAERGDGTVSASEVRSIEIDWVAGGATIEVVPDSEADGVVALTETSASKLSDNLRMRWGVVDHKLVVASGYERLGFGFWGCSLNAYESHLTLQLPESLARNLESVGVMAASGTYQLDGIGCDELSIDLASGQVTGQDLRAQRLDVAMASGNLWLNGAFAQQVKADIASGQATIACPDGCPQSTVIDMASGNMELLLPADAGFTAQVDKLSGSFACGFADGTTSLHSGACSHGDGSCTISVDMASGQVTVRPL